LRLDCLDDSGDKMREDRGSNRYDNGGHDDDSPKAKYIGRIETPILDHLQQPD